MFLVARIDFCTLCSLQLGFVRAQHYLSTRLKTLLRPYSVAITCYALAVSSQPCSKRVLLESASLGIFSHTWLHTVTNTYRSVQSTTLLYRKISVKLSDWTSVRLL